MGLRLPSRDFDFAERKAAAEAFCLELGTDSLRNFLSEIN
jgi:hypothetical protein